MCRKYIYPNLFIEDIFHKIFVIAINSIQYNCYRKYFFMKYVYRFYFYTKYSLSIQFIGRILVIGKCSTANFYVNKAQYKIFYLARVKETTRER